MKFKLLILLFLFNTSLKAGDIRGGDIRLDQLSPFTVRATINLNVLIHSNISQVEICWGDGLCEWIQPQQSWEFPEIDTKQLVFTNLHSYFQQATYQISVTECCWTNDLLNMPGADDYSFELEARFKLVNPDVEPLNAMTVFPDPLIIGNVDDFISYMAADPEELLSVQFCAPGIPAYERPDNIFPGQDDEIFLDTLDGGFIWAIPQVEGFFNLSLCASEYRDGELISETTRYISINVDAPVSTQTPESALRWKVYPNPATKEIYLYYDSKAENILEINVKDGSGKCIIRFIPVVNSDGTRSNALNISNLAAGFYYVYIKSKKGVKTIPFIKL